MGLLLQRLSSCGLLVGDGAWGTQLQARGLPAGACPETWNLERPEAVRAIAQAYAAAGSDVVSTNTFGGSRCKLAKLGEEKRCADLNRAGAAVSRAGAPGRIVAASVGPSGEMLAPLGDLEPEALEAVFREQIAALVAGGADAILVETLSDPAEAACAVRAAKAVDPTLDVAVTFTFARSPAGFHTMMGTTPAEAARLAAEAGADVVGSNCGNGMDDMVDICRAMAAATDRPVMIQANAGLPELVEGRTVFRETPEHMAGLVGALVEAGARIIGGCCGTTPAHIAAIAAAVGRARR